MPVALNWRPCGGAGVQARGSSTDGHGGVRVIAARRHGACARLHCNNRAGTPPRSTSCRSHRSTTMSPHGFTSRGASSSLGRRPHWTASAAPKGDRATRSRAYRHAGSSGALATSPGLSEPDFNHKNGAPIDHTRCAYFWCAMMLFLEHFPQKIPPPLIGGYTQLSSRFCTQPGPEKRGPGWILGWAERQGHARPPAGPVTMRAGRSLPAAM